MTRSAIYTVAAEMCAQTCLQKFYPRLITFCTEKAGSKSRHYGLIASRGPGQRRKELPTLNNVYHTLLKYLKNPF